LSVREPGAPLLPYTTLFRSRPEVAEVADSFAGAIDRFAGNRPLELHHLERETGRGGAQIGEDADRLVPGLAQHPVAMVLTNSGLDRKSTRLNSSHVKISYAA